MMVNIEELKQMGDERESGCMSASKLNHAERCHLLAQIAIVEQLDRIAERLDRIGDLLEKDEISSVDLYKMSPEEEKKFLNCK